MSPKINDHEKDRECLWETKDPLDKKVQLIRETQTDHVINDHKTDLSRSLSYPYVKEIIENPRFIYKDVKHKEQGRIKYTDQVYIEDYGHLQNMVIVVDTDRDPYEVVTWGLKRHLKEEIIDTDGGIIYDSHHTDK